MSKYGYMVKFNGQYYAAGEEVPDDIESPKTAVEPPQNEEQKKPEPVKPVSGNNLAAERPQMKSGK